MTGTRRDLAEVLAPFGSPPSADPVALTADGDTEDSPTGGWALPSLRSCATGGVGGAPSDFFCWASNPGHVRGQPLSPLLGPVRRDRGQKIRDGSTSVGSATTFGDPHSRLGAALRT